MTSFVSFVCHELRNPLQGILGSTEFLFDTLNKLDTLTSKLSRARDDWVLSPALTPLEKSGGIFDGNETSITGTVESQTILGINDLLSEAKQLVKNIQTCAEHQALITNNVLDLSRLDAGKWEPVYDVIDVYTLGPQTVAMMQARAQYKSIKISVKRKAPTRLYLKADTTIMSQVLLNLVSNAIKVNHLDDSFATRTYVILVHPGTWIYHN